MESEVKPTIDFYSSCFLNNSKMIGAFSIPRLIFPEIDNLGSYYAGTTNDTSKNAIQFMKKYFSRVNSEYSDKSAFIYFVYRHGLAHQHYPKEISSKGKKIGWAVGVSTQGVASRHLKLLLTTIQIDGRQFYSDLLGALEFYIKDVEQDSKLRRNFIKAHKDMYKPISIKKLLERTYISKNDLSFLK